MQPIATMDIIVNEGRDRQVYPGSSYVKVENKIPQYNGGVTMTIRVSEMGTKPNSDKEIVVDPDIRGGVPCVGKGNHPISHILEKIASGVSVDTLVHQSPDLTLRDIQLALDVASWVMRDPSIDWASLNLVGMVEFYGEMREWQNLSDDIAENLENTQED